MGSGVSHERYPQRVGYIQDNCFFRVVTAFPSPSPSKRAAYIERREYLLLLVVYALRSSPSDGVWASVRKAGERAWGSDTVCMYLPAHVQFEGGEGLRRARPLAAGERDV